MFVFGNLLVALAHVADAVLTLFYWLILIRALISWVSPDPYNPIVQFLYRMTEPVLEPFRRFLPTMVIDISPILAFLVIIFLKSFLVTSLYEIGRGMQ
ncbi:MAG: hypothetical protein A2787_01055 [Omnitrophica WOR_2 bacterium RIFCSPHIGHO2_01_FULL_48_9]|nr:MAG: hypothetical protein A3D10_03540 [Omnitrophica WOR_2 bacterium RIFCSPHIGHO2_02_FULL_48_11]OGX32159.1 MAG: hypothetical protein A2787_01055 [Omnitrophica WOR_2 bacterium RIFCSPHIGHO2_01_FULL_48_9]